MLFEVLDDKTKESYNRLLKECENFKNSDLQTRVLLAQLDEPRYYNTWEEMLEQSVLDTMARIQHNFMDVFRGYDLKRMLPNQNSEEGIVELFMMNFKNVSVISNWDDESVDLKKYIHSILHKYYLFLITIHANTSENVRPGIVKSFADLIKEYEDTKAADIAIYVKRFEELGGIDRYN